MPRMEFEPGSVRDRCGHCGGWISLGHAIGSSCRLRAMGIPADMSADDVKALFSLPDDDRMHQQPKSDEA